MSTDQLCCIRLTEAAAGQAHSSLYYDAPEENKLNMQMVISTVQILSLIQRLLCVVFSVGKGARGEGDKKEELDGHCL